MSPEAAIYVVRQAFQLMFMLAGPVLVSGLVIGLIVSVFQAATQIQEMTLTFIPKLIAVGLVLTLLFPWMLKIMHGFTRELIINFYYFLQ